MNQPTLFWRIIQFPITRIVLAFLIVMIPTGLAEAFFIANRETMPILQMPLVPLGVNILFVSIALFTYAFYVRVIEKRAVTELSTNRAARELGGGVLLGAFLFTLTIALLWLLGAYHIVRVNTWSALLPTLALSISSAVVEEILFRGILFRIVEESLGSILALIVSGLIFGALHLVNPNATLIAGIAIALEAGLLLGAAFMLTRRLWFAIGIHFAWNFTQGGIFGVNVSGNDFTGLLAAALSGPEWLSGGAFGAEASVVAVIVCLIAFAMIYRQAQKRGHVMPPFWKRRKDKDSTEANSSPDAPAPTNSSSQHQSQ